MDFESRSRRGARVRVRGLELANSEARWKKDMQDLSESRGALDWDFLSSVHPTVLQDSACHLCLCVAFWAQGRTSVASEKRAPRSVVAAARDEDRRQKESRIPA